ncbi:hypothetical protein [Psychrobacter ciconiae]|uniref:hypothetical protein n=1 Tax=Psychrobacter ciconiae TaxID=1553449 RepID=UPI00191B27A5|nr:hypothetical protein [Psychrobacter ciconiae]
MTKADKPKPTKSKNSWQWRDFFGELGGSVVNELLFLPLTLLPMVLLAWLFLTWGVLWLIFPLLLLITLFIWLFRDH